MTESAQPSANDSAPRAVSLRQVRRWLLLASLLLILVYLGCYFELRRRGTADMEHYNMDGILYVSVQEIEKTHDLSRHQFRRRLFAPVIWIDQKCFDAPIPITCMLFDLATARSRTNAGVPL